MAHSALVGLLLALLLAGCENGAQKGPRPGDPFPTIPLTKLDGTTFSTSQFANKVVVFNVWATWCPPCRHEMPDLERLSLLLESESVLVVGLAVDKDIKLVREFVRQQQLTFPIVVNPDHRASNLLRAGSLPTTFIINTQGLIVERIVGGRRWDEPAMVARIRQLAQASRPPSQQTVNKRP